ncbi:MAG: hypothetical protein KBG28_01055 [Kofleriaceae bacterium]|nr:hypothetical protein [Kofleriaceae bacterium]
MKAHSLSDLNITRLTIEEANRVEPMGLGPSSGQRPAKFLATLVILAACLLSRVPRANAAAGDWWCAIPEGWNWLGYTEIPVYVHPDLNDHVLFPDGTAWTDTEIRNEVEFMLERFMMQAPSGMPPLRFAGFEPAGTPPFSLPGAGKIAVRWNENGCGNFQQGSPATGMRIVATDNQTCGLKRTPVWNFFNPQQREGFGGQIASELFHALGFDHWDTCNTIPPVCIDNGSMGDFCSQMHHGVTSELYELERSDFDAILSVYGSWENKGRFRRESQGGSLWTTLAAPAILSGPIWSSAWSSTSTLLPIVATNPTTQDLHFYRWERSTAQIQDWGTPYSYGTQHGQIGAGYKSGMLFAFFALGQNPTDVSKTVHYAYAPSASNWTVVSSAIVADRHGVTGAYDPKSGKLVFVFRGPDNEILLTSATPGSAISTSISVVNGAENRAAYTPSIACGDSSISYNCIMVWATAGAEGSGQRTHTMRWVQFTFNGVNFSFANMYGNGYTMYGPPSVVYKGPPGSASAFVVAWHNPGHCYYTLQKAVGATSGFGVGGTHCSGSPKFIGPPLLGAADNYAQAWVQYNAAN